MRFLAIIVTALALVPAGAHLFEMPNKMRLSRADYFTIQKIYRGWALLGVVLPLAMLVDLIFAITLRDQPVRFAFAFTAFLLIGATLAVFFLWTYPANQITENWTLIPADWERLRRQWEYSHAVNAVLTFLALCSITLAALLPPE